MTQVQILKILIKDWYEGLYELGEEEINLLNEKNERVDLSALKKEFGKLPRGLPNATTGVTVVDMINYALGKDRVIDTEDGDSQSPKLISWDRGGKVIGRPNKKN